MRNTIALTAVVALLMTGCARAPSAVEPTLDAVETLGYACDGGHPDNVPSGLSQWRCAATGERGSAGESPTGVLVAGNDKGVMEVVLAMGTGPQEVGSDAARAAWSRLADAVPPMNGAPALKEALAGWTGAELATAVGGARVYADCSDGACLIQVDPAGDALQPLHLP